MPKTYQLIKGYPQAIIELLLYTLLWWLNLETLG